MKKLLIFGSALLLVAVLIPVHQQPADATFSASVDCDYVRSGRGACTAYPQGSGFSYSWWTSGGGAVANRNTSSTSAACGGTYSLVYVRVTDASGNSDTAWTSGACSGGR